jgi:hypothetical protein
MEKTYLQTVVSGCAWCGTTIGFSTHEVSRKGDEQFLLLSHGICLDCKNVFDHGDDESEDESEEDLVFA